MSCMVVPTLIRPSITAPIAADYISVIFGPDAQLALQCGPRVLVTHVLDTIAMDKLTGARNRRFTQHYTHRLRGRELWSRGGISEHRSRGPRRCASPLVADARNKSVELERRKNSAVNACNGRTGATKILGVAPARQSCALTRYYKGARGGSRVALEVAGEAPRKPDSPPEFARRHVDQHQVCI